MDVESLAKELILKNMTPEQQMAVLDSVKASVAQAREVQKRKIGENVDIVVQALKTIESDIRSRFDDVGNVIEKRVASIKDGRDGSNGKDGRDGKDGKNGRDGAKGEKGETGQNGIDGINGVDGVSVTNAHIDFDGSLVITLSTGVELNVGEVVAPDLAESIKVITNGGGTSQSVLDTLDSLQTQITNLIPSQTGKSGKYLTTNGTSTSWASVTGVLSYQGTWNASTNSPTLTSSSGTNGYYYVVATAGSTSLNGITDWQVGDWLIFNGSTWQKLDQTNLVTSVAGKTGAVVLNNTDVSGFASIAAAGGTTVLTVSSAPNYVVTGSGGQTIQLPDATTLSNGAIFSFNNNQSSGTIIVKNNSSTTVATIQSGGYVSLVLLSNSLAAGSWDVHNYAPSNVSWSTNTFDYAGSITSATWNGTAVAYNRGGTGQSSAFVAGGVVYGSSTSALAVTPIGTTGQVLTSAGAGTPTWTTPTTGTVTSVSGTTGRITSTGGATPVLDLTSGIATAGTTGSSSLIPVITIDTYGRVTGITTASNPQGTVTSVTGTSPVASSGGATPAISLSSGYGDTLNPYASKTAKYVLAAPNGADGVPTFRAIVASDIPTLNQNSTGYSTSLAGGNNTTLLGSLPYQSNSNTTTLLAPNTSTTKNFLSMTGSGTNGAAPVWGTIAAGDVPTLNQNTTGSAATLTTARAIYGNNFDGSAALTQVIASTYGGTGNGFTKFTGATTAERTYTLPDATTTILTTNAAVTIGQGGTGQTTASAAFDALAPSQATNSGKYLTTNGTTTSWASVSSSGTVTSVAATVPSFLSISGSPITTSGTLAISYSGTALPVANGGTGVTTSTGSGANVLGTSPTLTSPAFAGTPTGVGVLSSGTAVASTSGTAIDFTSIPSWVKRVTVMFNGVSITGGANFLIQIGAGSITSTGYVSSTGIVRGSTGLYQSSTAGFIAYNGSSTYTHSGHFTITNVSSNIWVCSHVYGDSGADIMVGGGNISLGGTLDRVRITTTNGTDTFDAGSINILYE